MITVTIKGEKREYEAGTSYETIRSSIAAKSHWLRSMGKSGSCLKS